MKQLGNAFLAGTLSVLVMLVFFPAYRSISAKVVPMNSTNKTEMIAIYDSHAAGLVTVKRIVKSDAEWKAQLGTEKYNILRGEGTECAFTGAYDKNKQSGIYHCGACGTELFVSRDKFASGTGWPSFFQPIHSNNIEMLSDTSLGMLRTEVRCARCGSHLGHVFDDGPQPTGQRYCINSAALEFTADASPAVASHPKTATTGKIADATFAAGCFWGVEDAFRQLPGVLSTEVGYSGGHTNRPTYEEVCSDRTGHAEAVHIQYNPDRVSYLQLLALFWRIHDPTQVNRQGPDSGTQYRSVIFYHSPEQKQLANAAIQQLGAEKKYPLPIATEIAPAGPFYRAEEYHQQYNQKHGRPSCHI